MTAMLAPKLKAEYVAAIAARSTVSKSELEIHSVDRLKEIWALIKPLKHAGRSSMCRH